MEYNAFISYSHAADEKLAPAIQAGLKKFAKPWNKLRALEIFRDKTNLSVSPGLWPSIEKALSESEYFILMASPEAANSPWVRKEIDFWLENRSPHKILIILTSGDALRWNEEAKDFHWPEAASLPDNLKGKFAEEPLWLDLRWAKAEEQLSLRNPKFSDGIARLAAPLHGKALDEISGEDVRQHKFTIRLKCGAILALTTLLIAALGLAYWAIGQAEIARRGAYNAQVARASDLWQRDSETALRLLTDTDRVPEDLRDFSWGILYGASKKKK